MKSIQNSTKTQPLLFFEQFLKKESLLSFEREFYEMPINQSFKAYRDLGYVEYTKDLYEDKEEATQVRIIFNDALKKRLKIQSSLSLRYIKERKEEIENIENNSNVYLNQQIFKLDTLKKSLDCNDPYRSIVINFLDEIKNNLLSFLEEEPSTNLRTIDIKISGITFFDLKKEVKLRHLKKLYEVTVLLSIIDDDLVTEEEFLNVLISPRLPVSKAKIIFKKNNRIAVYYLNVIASFFNEFKPVLISRSQSFIKKGGKGLDENNINSINSFLRNNDVSRYNYIKEEIEKILPI